MGFEAGSNNLDDILMNILIPDAKDSVELNNIKYMLQSLEDDVYIKDRNLRFVFVGKNQATKFASNGFQDVIGKTGFDIFSENQAKDLFEREQIIMNTGIPLEGAIEKEIWPDEHISWIFAFKYPLVDVSGNIIGVWGTSTDINVEKLINEELENVKRDLEDNMNSLEKCQKIVFEKERLASLGQMIGGIAHNLKTPIMSLANGLEVLKNLIKEYDQSIESDLVTKEDHHEISREMLSWVEKLKPLCSYASDIISTVKLQAVQKDDSATDRFCIEDLLKRIDILMKHELQRNNCKIKKHIAVNTSIQLIGEINSLVQVFNNLINNAIDSYENQGGEIELKIFSDGKDIVFSIKDYGKGIKEEVQNNLFKSMVTTKGKNGTGLGLYLSYATIKGRFGGEMRFKSEEGKGSTFCVTIPIPENIA